MRTEERVERESGELSAALTRREEALLAVRAAESRKRRAEGAVREHRQVGDELREEFEEVIREMEGVTMPEEVNAEAIKAALGTVRSSLVPVEASLTGLEMSAAYARLVEQERGSGTGSRTSCFRSEFSGGGSACKLTSGSNQSDSEAGGRRTR